MLIKEILFKANLKLKSKIGDSALLESEMILASILKITREKLLTDLNKKVTPSQISKFDNYVDRRLKLEPLAYIIGYKYFCDLKLKVNKNTLIPRPETEELVELVINFIASNKDKVIDVGTGSGAIALSIKNKAIKNKVIGIDNSSGALRIARLNAKENKLKVTFLKSDLLDKVKKEDLKNSILAVNLPYVDRKEIKDFPSYLKKALDYEPDEAIFAKKNGTEVYEKLFLQLKKIDKKYLPGLVIMEIGSFYYEKFLELAKSFFPLAKIDLKNDFLNRPRFIIIDLKK